MSRRNVWQLPCETVLNGGLPALPLAPFADVAATNIPAGIWRIDERIPAEAENSAQVDELWMATSILMGLRYNEVSICTFRKSA
jgi:hypothetical protein